MKQPQEEERPDDTLRGTAAPGDVMTGLEVEATGESTELLAGAASAAGSTFCDEPVLDMLAGAAAAGTLGAVSRLEGAVTGSVLTDGVGPELESASCFCEEGTCGLAGFTSAIGFGAAEEQSCNCDCVNAAWQY